MNRSTVLKGIMGALVTCGLMVTVQAEVYKQDTLITHNRTELAGGSGTVEAQYAFMRNDALEAHAIKEISWLTLPPGSSIGFHAHSDNEDAYIIISGHGLFIDSDGTEHSVNTGDVTIVRPGGGHGLTNSGTEPLIILDVIGKK